MGLDITAISNIVPMMGDEDLLLDSIGMNTEVFYVHPHFSNKVAEFKDYTEDNKVSYMTSDTSKVHAFRVGSYSTHNQFKNKISKIMIGVTLETLFDNLDDYVDHPFFEFLDMSDCNGSIGPNVSKTILKDFIDYRDKFMTNLEENGDTSDKWMVETYDNWIKSFEYSAQDGILMFQ